MPGTSAAPIVVPVVPALEARRPLRTCSRAMQRVTETNIRQRRCKTWQLERAVTRPFMHISATAVININVRRARQNSKVAWVIRGAPHHDRRRRACQDDDADRLSCLAPTPITLGSYRFWPWRTTLSLSNNLHTRMRLYESSDGPGPCLFVLTAHSCIVFDCRTSAEHDDTPTTQKRPIDTPCLLCMYRGNVPNSRHLRQS